MNMEGLNLDALADLPLAAPPPNVTPNFEHPQSCAPAAQIGLGICIGIVSIFVVLRLYAKLTIVNNWGWEDCELI